MRSPVERRVVFPAFRKQEVLVFNLDDSDDRLVPIEIAYFCPTAASICVERLDPEEDRHFLLVQRGTDPGKGLWTFPGGRQDWRIRTTPLFPSGFRHRFLEIARRELEEETGIKAAHVGERMFGFRYPTHRLVIFEGLLARGDESWLAKPRPGEGIQAVDWFSGPQVQAMVMDLTPHIQKVMPFFL
jgi:ADP-ribose pyrophosphatase YjhB (NUDIX family)